MKSYVGMEYKVCPVCTTKFPTDTILFDRRLRNSLERETVTGWALCNECQSRNAQGYIALVAVKNEGKHLPKPEEVYREGIIVHLKREVALKLIPELEPDIDKPFLWAPKSLCEQLVRMEERRAKDEGEVTP